MGAMHLTPRQREILELVAMGLSDKEIGARLGLSRRTVSAHLDRLFHEHGVHKRAAAVAAWLRAQESVSNVGVSNVTRFA